MFCEAQEPLSSTLSLAWSLGPHKDIGVLCARGGSSTFSSSTVTSCARACFFLGPALFHCADALLS